MAHLESHVRYRGSLVSITDVRCRPSSCGLSSEEQAHEPEVVFPRTGLFVKHTGRQKIVADANHVLFFNAREAYRVSHPKLGGDDCTAFVFSAEILQEAIAMYEPALCEDPESPFRLSHGLVEPQTIIRQQQLRQRLNDRSAIPLEIEELALRLLYHVVRDIYGRCVKPRRQSRQTAQLQRQWVESVRLLIAERPEAKLSLANIARKVYCSPFHLSRLFRAAIGSSIHQYQLRLRLALALERLLDRPANLTALSLDLGFSSHSHFTAAFQRAFGTSPSAFRSVITTSRIRKLSKILKA